MDINELTKAKVKDQDIIKLGNRKMAEKVFKQNTELLKRFIIEGGWSSKER